MRDHIKQLRDRLQAPRRPYDTWYGRFVMRRLSIYLTFLFSKTPLSPSAVTLISLVLGITGAVKLCLGDWFSGVLLVNGWYLLDHADGELARLRQVVSVRGFYFDTMTNVLVVPFTFAAIGIALGSKTANPLWLWVGLASAFGSLMLMVMPFGRDAVFLQWIRQKGAEKTIEQAPARSDAAPGQGALKSLFSACHWWVTFPVFLPVVSILVVGFNFNNPPMMETGLKVVTLLYAVLANGVWLTILARDVLTAKLDRDLAAIMAPASSDSAGGPRP